jgi:uncharacterized repeat protein (TIGR01451 family)
VQAQTCSALTGVVNTYAQVTAIGGNVVTINSTTYGASAPFAVGDYVILIQMTGAPPPQSGSNMGKYELKKVTAVSGTNITLNGITNTYTTSEKVQLVRVPYCPTATVTGAVTAKVWDGTTGGIVALKGNTLTLSAKIDASATGFSATNPLITSPFTSLSTGLGTTDGRGKAGSSNPGGGLTGGGGASTSNSNEGGGLGGGGSILTSGTDGGAPNSLSSPPKVLTGGGGGGGIIGGGGGGAGDGSGKDVFNGKGGGNGGGVAGGGAGGVGGQSALMLSASLGGGGGGVQGVGMGVDGTCVDSCSGSGGGSYGGGGGAASAFAGGDDSYGGGGGGSWTGGGIAGQNGSAYTIVSSGAGNDPVSIAITDSYHFLNNSNARLMMGGAGGSSTCQEGGIGGGIVLIDFTSVSGNNNSIISNGESKGLAPYCPTITPTPPSISASGAGGAGGGGGGQMILNVGSFTSSTTIEAKGGKGGDGNSPVSGGYHGGTGGAGGGGGGIWIYGSTTSSNTGGQTISVANTNLSGAGATLAGVSGGSAGASTNNPKNSRTTGTGGAGGNGLIIQSSPPTWVACTNPSPFSITGTNPTCASTTSGSIAFGSFPATGTYVYNYDDVNPYVTGVLGANASAISTTSLTGLAAGTYTVRLFDATDNTCYTDANVTLNPASGCGGGGGQPDLELTKTVDKATAVSGNTLTYTLTLKNIGTANATGVVVKDSLPAGLTFSSATASQGSYSDTTGLWTVGTVAVGATLTLTITATIN